ncbi:hypothetical protein CPB84DRAFT_1846110 [Gymnopilus junonius]|uniref:Uncharacterized protein n=1 Tax=Gymnopilus junonius TaxID=109634 RepID=A0A9P5TN76_GYMJU|nr:hypothetical protein CPB84DRAFT_1846110 [Gymnopilus junonius]
MRINASLTEKTAENFLTSPNDAELEQWKVSVQNGIENNDWMDLWHHRAGTPVLGCSDSSIDPEQIKAILHSWQTEFAGTSADLFSAAHLEGQSTDHYALYVPHLQLALFLPMIFGFLMLLENFVTPKLMSPYYEPKGTPYDDETIKAASAERIKMLNPRNQPLASPLVAVVMEPVFLNYYEPFTRSEAYPLPILSVFISDASKFGISSPEPRYSCSSSNHMAHLRMDAKS